MKILIVGSWQHSMYEDSFYISFNKLGHDVHKLSWAPYFLTLLGRLESKYSICGPITFIFNIILYRKINSIKPDVVLIWRGTSILTITLKQIKNKNIHTISYNHDDFTGPELGAPVPWHHKRFWKLFLQNAKYYDIHFVKRQSNIEHLLKLGAKKCYLMPMWFVPEIHKKIILNNEDLNKYQTDVVFVGHYEPDKREEYIFKLLENNINVKIWGGKYWNKNVLKDYFEILSPIKQVEDIEYTKALTGSKICLCFLSKINRDTYTRRCFEIPACGKLLFTERTSDLLLYFKEDIEAVFFSNVEEFVYKIKWLLSNPNKIDEIANAGYKRVWNDKHDVDSKVLYLISKINENERN
jgi:spore maturation protein CgeB